MLIMKYTHKTIEATLQLLEKGGGRQRECVVLWLGKRFSNNITVEQVYLPEQNARVDMFHIPPASMQKLMRYLKDNKLMVASQVHTHPGKAFHSKADDDWAFVRHENAISIVLPSFATNTTPSNFWAKAETYRLTNKNIWEHIPESILGSYCRKI